MVAVGANNFQASSQGIRLRTFAKDGKPVLGNSRLPTGFVHHDESRRGSADDQGEGPDSQTTTLPTVEAATIIEGGVVPARDLNGGVAGQRRNTLGRRHSPSVASSDRPQIRGQANGHLEISLEELNEKFESIRKEIEDTSAHFTKDESDALRQEQELKAEKEKKRLALKEKEEQTTQLKTMVRTTMEQMRVAEKERSKREQQLKEKENKKTKVRDSASKLEQDIDQMKKDRENLKVQKAELLKKSKLDTKAISEANSKLHDKCSELEAELKDKGKQLQDLKATRESLPDADDEQWREDEARLQMEWDIKRKRIHGRLVSELKESHHIDQQIKTLTEQLAMQQQAAYFNQAPPADLDTSLQPGSKRHSVNGPSISPPPMAPSPIRLPATDAGYSGAPAFSHPPFPPRLFTDVDDEGDEDDQAEAELRATSGPLSPTAQTLLPSNIFDEMGDVYDQQLPDSISVAEGNAAQSPSSSDESANVFSSPHGSANNLPFQSYVDASEERLRNLSPTNVSPSPGHRFTNLLSGFHRSRGGRPSMEEGLPIGSLKSTQSQSFPRSGDESEAPETKRRLNFPWVNRNSGAPDNSSFFSGRRVNSLRNSNSPAFLDGEQDNSRPASIASTDLPRPSTDSGSIWGVPLDSGMSKPRLWPGDGRWPSRSGSRRPSIHGSNTALTTTLASADDEILDDLDMRNPKKSPSQIGVIGSRPPAFASSMSQKLNPGAPTFMDSIFRKDKNKDGKGKTKEVATPSIELTPSLEDSPSDSRVSRDAYSVHTQPSITESYESLVLDGSQSNAASDVNSNAGSLTKDQENVVKKLFRKGSSSKFSLSSRLGKDSSLFKKGPGSTTNSDKNMSADQRSSIGDIDDLGEDTSQYGRSYESMTSSPSLSQAKSKDTKDSRKSNWRFSVRKKGKDVMAKEKESLDIERATDEE